MFKILSVCKGGGYMYCRTEPVHPKANSKGLYPLHRVLVENSLGRLLFRDEQVHHKDGNRDNNSIENLSLLSCSDHAKLHAKHVEMIKLVCPVCQYEFEEKPSRYRQRIKRNKTHVLYCSRRCGGKAYANIAR